MKRLLLALTLAAAGCGAGADGRVRDATPQPAPTPRPATARLGDEGRYVVTRVLIDPALDNMQARWFLDDPRLLGRIVTVASDRLDIDSELPCTRPRRIAARRTVAQVLRAASQRRNAAAARAPTPADYGLAVASSGPVATVSYACLGLATGGPGGNSGNGWNGAVGWAVGRGGGRALLWQRETILVLTPMAMAGVSGPSFPCSRARTVTERAICADPSLANWDRSVAAAYRLGLDGSAAGEGWEPADDRAALQEGHRAWLAERDRCGADRNCLLDRMAERTDALMRRQY